MSRGHNPGWDDEITPYVKPVFDDDGKIIPPTLPTSPKPDGGGLRNNALKNRLDLLPPEWLWALADVMTRGSLKYAERNWERGMKWSILVGCTLRHLYKFIAGERYDKEIGCHHLAMAAWNLLALMSYDLKGVGEDDIRTSTDMGTLEAVADIPIEEVAEAVRAKKDLEAGRPDVPPSILF